MTTTRILVTAVLLMAGGVAPGCDDGDRDRGGGSAKPAPPRTGPDVAPPTIGAVRQVPVFRRGRVQMVDVPPGADIETLQAVGRIVIESVPDGATIEIDGVRWDAPTRTAVVADPGNYRITVTKDPQYHPWVGTVTVAVGKPATVKAVLVKRNP